MINTFLSFHLDQIFLKRVPRNPGFRIKVKAAVKSINGRPNYMPRIKIMYNLSSIH